MNDRPARHRGARLTAGALAVCALVAACSSNSDSGVRARRPAPVTSTAETVATVAGTDPTGSAAGPDAGDMILFEAPPGGSGLGDGWNDYGWAATLVDGGPTKLALADYGGWIIAHPGLTGAFDSVSLRVHADASLGTEFLTMRLGDDLDSDNPQLPIDLVHDDDGALSGTVPVADLLAGAATFDRVIIQASTDEPADATVDIDAVWMSPQPSTTTTLPVAGSTAAAAASVDCSAAPTPISPHIYGIAFDDLTDATDDGQWEMDPDTRRWGGNATTRYNWQTGDWNTAADYFFRNVPALEGDVAGDKTYRAEDWSHGVLSAVTVPMIGWVAKDDHSYSFPVATFGTAVD